MRNKPWALFFRGPVFETPNEGVPAAAPAPTSETTAQATAETQTLIGGGTEAATEEGATQTSAPVEEPFTAESLGALVPEGMSLPEEVAGPLLEAINGATTRQELVQTLFSKYGEIQQEAAQQQAQAWESTIRGWEEQVKSLPDLGGERLPQTLATANEVANKYGGKGFLQMLNVTGAGSHPEMVKFLSAIHAELPKETATITGAPKGEAKSLAERLFSQ